MHPADDPTSLGSIVLERNHLDEPQLKEAVRLAKSLSLKLGRYLRLFGGLTNHQVDAMLAKQAHERTPRWSALRRSKAARAAADAAIRATDEHAEALVQGVSTARKITLHDFEED